MNDNQWSGLKAGLISGLIWGALMSLVSFLEVQTKYTAALNYYGDLYAQNSSVFGGKTPIEYINYNLEFNAVLFLAVGIGFGALVGLLFVYINPKFLPRQSYAIKGLIVSVFLWLLFNLSLVEVFDPFELVSSLAVSLFGGYLLAFLYSKSVRTKAVKSPGSKPISKKSSMLH
jgi:hypothetical protein